MAMIITYDKNGELLEWAWRDGDDDGLDNDVDAELNLPPSLLVRSENGFHYYFCCCWDCDFLLLLLLLWWWLI